MNKQFKDKKVLITGGSSGLGKALALKFLNEGAQVSVIARNESPLKKLQIEHPNLNIIQGDVSDKNSIHRIYSEAIAQLENIDILINNASSLGQTPLRLLLDTDCETLEEVLQTNLVGPFRLTKLIVPQMIMKESGWVVNISSDAAVSAYPKWGSYAVSKAALDHLTRLFAEELKDSGIHFLALDPGDMNTPLHLAAIPDADTNRLRKPEESAQLILNLLAAGDYQNIRQSI